MTENPTSIVRLATLEPSQIALVCVDFQNDFCHSEGKAGHGASSNAAAAERANDVAARFIARGAHVIYTKQELDPAQLTDKQRQFESPDGLCLVGSWGAELYLSPVEGAHVITKHRFDTWQSKKFTGLLDDLGIEGLVFAGLELRCCLLFAVMGADERGCRYTAPQDLISGVDDGNETYNMHVREYLRQVHNAPESVEAFLQAARL